MRHLNEFIDTSVCLRHLAMAIISTQYVNSPATTDDQPQGQQQIHILLQKHNVQNVRKDVDGKLNCNDLGIKNVYCVWSCQCSPDRALEISSHKHINVSTLRC